MTTKDGARSAWDDRTWSQDESPSGPAPFAHVARAQEQGEAAECRECAAKPGSPALCPACLHNRTLVDRLKERVVELERPPALTGGDLAQKTWDLTKNWDAAPFVVGRTITERDTRMVYDLADSLDAALVRIEELESPTAQSGTLLPMITTSPAPVATHARICENCGFRLDFTYESTRPHHKNPDGTDHEPAGTYLDCPRQTCRHANRVPSLANVLAGEVVAVTVNAPEEAPASVAPVEAPPPAEVAPVDAPADPTPEIPTLREGRCACVTRVLVGKQSAVPSFDAKTYRCIGMGAADNGRMLAYFAKLACPVCDGTGYTIAKDADGAP